MAALRFKGRILPKKKKLQPGIDAWSVVGYATADSYDLFNLAARIHDQGFKVSLLPITKYASFGSILFLQSVFDIRSLFLVLLLKMLLNVFPFKDSMMLFHLKMSSLLFACASLRSTILMCPEAWPSTSTSMRMARSYFGMFQVKLS